MELNSPTKSLRLMRHHWRKLESRRSASNISSTNGIRAKATDAGGRARRSTSSWSGREGEVLPWVDGAVAT
jgi:hypothetical protein